MAKVKISIIAAIGPNRELGKNNKLLWDIPEDLARFKKLTQGHAVIMGRKTYESIGKPLPNRINIVITRDIKKFIMHTRHRVFSSASPRKGGSPKRLTQKQVSSLSLVACSSLEEAIECAKKLITNNEVFIIGGGQIYQQTLPYADKLYLTIVEGDYEADTYFPDYSTFKHVVYTEKRTSDNYTYTFLELEK